MTIASIALLPPVACNAMPASSARTALTGSTVARRTPGPMPSLMQRRDLARQRAAMYTDVQMSKRRPRTMTMSEARASFATVLDGVERGEPVQVTRGSKPVAVIVSIEQYREAQRDTVTAAEAFRSFMKTLDRRTLRGAAPWEGARDRTTGRVFRW